MSALSKRLCSLIVWPQYIRALNILWFDCVRWCVGRVWQRGNQLESHWVRWQPGSTGHDRDEADEYLCSRRRGVEVSSGDRQHFAGQTEQQPRQEQELPQTQVRHQHAVWTQSLCRRRLLWHEGWATISCGKICFIDGQNFVYVLNSVFHIWHLNICVY